jgi:uncharacterized membrane protein YeaQ/YmgE (transglycosylase-associated protein family)
MNIKVLVIVSLVGGLVSTALSNIPGLNLVNCLLCSGFWAGPLLAVWLYKRQTGTVLLGQAVIIGTVAGLCAGILGFILSLVGLAGVGALAHNYARFMPPDAELPIPPVGPEAVVFNIAGIFTNIFFGAVGGLAGGALFKTRQAPPPAGE